MSRTKCALIALCLSLAAAVAGVGVVNILDIFVHRALESGALVRVYGDWNAGVKTFYAVMIKDRATSAKVRAFTDFLMEVLDSERRPSATRAVSVRALGKR